MTCGQSQTKIPSDLIIHQKLLQRLNNPDIHSLHVHLVTSQHPFTQKSHPSQKYGQSHPYLLLLIPFA